MFFYDSDLVCQFVSLEISLKLTDRPTWIHCAKYPVPLTPTPVRNRAYEDPDNPTNLSSSGLLSCPPIESIKTSLRLNSPTDLPLTLFLPFA